MKLSKVQNVEVIDVTCRSVRRTGFPWAKTVFACALVGVGLFVGSNFSRGNEPALAERSVEPIEVAPPSATDESVQAESEVDELRTESLVLQRDAYNPETLYRRAGLMRYGRALHYERAENGEIILVTDMFRLRPESYDSSTVKLGGECWGNSSGIEPPQVLECK